MKLVIDALGSRPNSAKASCGIDPQPALSDNRLQYAERQRSSEGALLNPEIGRRFLVFHVEPRPRAAGLVRAIYPLGYDALKAQLAGMNKNSSAIGFNVFAQPNAGFRFPEYPS